MKFLLAAINAKYIHSNPGVYSLRAFARTKIPGADIEIGEYTINHQMDLILQDIYRRKPDFIGFSCYIWNISYIMEIVRDVKKVLPEVEIWLGGPEVSYDAKKVLTREPDVCGVMRGEGELTFTELVRAYLKREELCAASLDLDHIPGITYRAESGEVVERGPQRLLSLDEIPFYYDDMAGFENRIVYYESSRGCPFSCSYCLSSIDKTVRFRSLDLVLPELQFFLDHKVPQVKFVDRTFNCKRDHTLGIWRYLVEHDNGITNFHFEVSADIFDEEELELIGKMRPGLIQLEIGVQSTNPDTIKEIHRHMDLVKLKQAVDRVYDYRNTHQHLDLIAGLPYEKNGLTGISHSRLARYEILYRFLEEKEVKVEQSTPAAEDPAGMEQKTGVIAAETAVKLTLADFRDSLMYDLYVRENIKSLPSFASDQSPYKKEVREFFMAEEESPQWLTDYAGFDSKQMAKMAHLEHMEDGTFVLFDYKNRDPLSGNARAVRFRYDRKGSRMVPAKPARI